MNALRLSETYIAPSGPTTIDPEMPGLKCQVVAEALPITRDAPMNAIIATVIATARERNNIAPARMFPSDRPFFHERRRTDDRVNRSDPTGCGSDPSSSASQAGLSGGTRSRPLPTPGR